MTLDGLERTIKESCPRKRKVNFIRYADDFIVTADSRELLENNIIPAINEFLKPRGLRLSAEKTRIVRIEQGFDFPGQHLQKYRNKLIITPSKDNTRSFLSRLRERIRSSHGWKTEETIFQSLWRWIKRRHPQKSCGWIIKHYFNNLNRKWVFSCWIKDRSGKKRLLELIKPSFIKLVRYIKIKGESNPFDPQYTGYFSMRRTFSNYYPIQSNSLTAGFQ